jgi:hypothetical protein
MSNETVMLLSAGIAAGVSLLTFALTRIFDMFNEKRKEKERFFYEIFPKRIELYNDIIKATKFITGNDEWQDLKNKEDVVNFLNRNYYNLLDIYYRCVVFGSLKITNMVGKLNEVFSVYGSKLLDDSVPFSMIELSIFTRTITTTKIHIAELIREESCTYMIDNKISDFLKNLKIKKKSPEDVT